MCEPHAGRATGGRPVSAVVGTPACDGRNNLPIAKGHRVAEATGSSGHDTFVADVFGDALAGDEGNDRFFRNGGAAPAGVEAVRFRDGADLRPVGDPLYMASARGRGGRAVSAGRRPRGAASRRCGPRAATCRCRTGRHGRS